MKKSEGVTFWVIYDSPEDYPNAVVVRPQTVADDGVTLYGGASVFRSVKEARLFCMTKATTKIPRNAKDAVAIVETWI